MLDTIKALNNSITGYIHDDAIRQGMLSANGPSHTNPRDVIKLNSLEDWLQFRAVAIALIQRKVLIFGMPVKIDQFSFVYRDRRIANLQGSKP